MDRPHVDLDPTQKHGSQVGRGSAVAESDHSAASQFHDPASN